LEQEGEEAVREDVAHLKRYTRQLEDDTGELVQWPNMGPVELLVMQRVRDLVQCLLLLVAVVERMDRETERE
jgi:hypothetical protein